MKLIGNTEIWLDILCSSETEQQLKLEFTVVWLLLSPPSLCDSDVLPSKNTQAELVTAAVRKISVLAGPWGRLIYSASGPRAFLQAYARGFRPYRSGQLFSCTGAGEVFRISGVTAE